MTKDPLAGRKTDDDGRYRFNLALKEYAARLFYLLAETDQRSLAGELSYLVVERARELGLDAPGHVGEQSRDR